MAGSPVTSRPVIRRLDAVEVQVKAQQRPQELKCVLVRKVQREDSSYIFSHSVERGVRFIREVCTPFREPRSGSESDRRRIQAISGGAGIKGWR